MIVFDTLMEIALIIIVFLLSILALILYIRSSRHETIEETAERLSDEDVILLERLLKIKRIYIEAEKMGVIIDYDAIVKRVDKEYKAHLINIRQQSRY